MQRSTVKRLLMTSALPVMLVLAGVVTYSVWVRSASPHGSLVLKWTDPDSDCTFAVHERPGALVKNYSTLSVRCGDEEVAATIDDDVGLATVRFVRFREWLLVLNEQYVVAGYNFAESSLVGEHSWSRLPFTIWEKAGTVVASAGRKAGQRFGIPVGFPMIPEPQGAEPQAGRTATAGAHD
jgi:hypothetical protein